MSSAMECVAGEFVATTICLVVFLSSALFTWWWYNEGDGEKRKERERLKKV